MLFIILFIIIIIEIIFTKFLNKKLIIIYLYLFILIKMIKKIRYLIMIFY